MARPVIYDDELRLRLIAIAADIAATEGQHAVRMRHLAEAAGTSTAAIYSLFSGREGLMAAVVEHTLVSFVASQQAAPATGDPKTDLLALGVAYINWAIANPGLYPILFGQPGSLTSGGANPVTKEIIYEFPLTAVLYPAVERSVASGRTPCFDVDALLFAAWSVVHGLASLTVLGALPGADLSERRCLAISVLTANVDSWFSDNTH